MKHYEQLEEVFGERGALIYDEDCSVASSRYVRARATGQKMIRSALATSETGSHVVLDFGAGTANDGLFLLRHEPNAVYVGIDYSPHMLSVADAKLRASGFERYSLLELDLLSSVALTQIRAHLQARWATKHVDCIVSSLSLHHIPLQIKRTVFALAHSLLREGGIFVLTDLFANEIEFCHDFALALEVEDVREIENRRVCTDLAKWPSTLTVEHYLHVNTPEPLVCELDLLRKARFAFVDVAYREGQLAVVVGRKAPL